MENLQTVAGPHDPAVAKASRMPMAETLESESPRRIASASSMFDSLSADHRKGGIPDWTFPRAAGWARSFGGRAAAYRVLR